MRLPVRGVLQSGLLLACGLLIGRPGGTHGTYSPRGYPTPSSDSVVYDSTKIIARNLGSFINTVEHEYGAWPSADGLTLYYAGIRPDTVGGDDIYKITRSLKDGVHWSRPINVRELNTSANEGAISLSPDGKTIYFATSRGANLSYDANIMTAHLVTGGWMDVHPVGAPVNTLVWESHPCISPDGKKLFFASTRVPHVGKKSATDIYVSHLLISGTWGKPVNLGSQINTEDAEYSPFMAEDGKTLYFSSARPGGLGKLDIYRSVWLGPSDTDWTPPVRLPAPINSDKDDSFFVLVPGGGSAFLTSNRKGGSGSSDLWEIIGLK